MSGLDDASQVKVIIERVPTIRDSQGLCVLSCGAIRVLVP